MSIYLKSIEKESQLKNRHLYLGKSRHPKGQPFIVECKSSWVDAEDVTTKEILRLVHSTIDYDDYIEFKDFEVLYEIIQV